MIRGEITLCGTISRTAELKSSKKGNEFIAFPVKYTAEGRDGSKKDIEINVSADGTKESTAIFTTGRRISVKGILNIRLHNGVTYYNLRAESEPALVSSTEEDKVEGTVNFSGKTSKRDIRIGKDKNGREYIGFSGFDRSKKDNGDPEFLWMNFMYFHPSDQQKDIVKPSTYLDIDGDLSIGVYKDRISLDCIVKNVQKHEF